MNWVLVFILGGLVLSFGGLLFMCWLDDRRTKRIVKEYIDKYWK